MSYTSSWMNILVFGAGLVNPAFACTRLPKVSSSAVACDSVFKSYIPTFKTRFPKCKLHSFMAWEQKGVELSHLLIAFFYWDNQGKNHTRVIKLPVESEKENLTFVKIWENAAEITLSDSGFRHALVFIDSFRSNTDNDLIVSKHAEEWTSSLWIGFGDNAKVDEFHVVEGTSLLRQSEKLKALYDLAAILAK